jgi:hypothetical protein
VARRRKLTKVSVSIVGAVIFIMLFGVIASGGQDLNLASPFSNDFDFLVLDSIFPALDISALSQGVVISDFIQDSPNGGLNYFCKLKMNTVVNLKGQPSFELNTQFQPFSPLVPTAQLTTRAGSELIDFASEPRLACDVILATNGDRLDYKITTQNLKLRVTTFDQNGNLILVQSKLIGLSSPVLFSDSQNISPITGDPEFIGSERAIGRKTTTLATDIENKLNPPSTLSTRVEFRLSGNLLIEIPELSQKLGQTFRVTATISDEQIVNAMTVVLPVEIPTTVGGDDLKITITDINPSIFATDGTDRVKLVKVSVRVSDFGSNESNPICTVHKQLRTGISSTSIAGVISTFQSTNTIGTVVNSNFLCTLKIGNDVPIGTYAIKAKTNAVDRPTATSTFEITRTLTTCTGGQVLDPDTKKCVTAPPPTNGNGEPPVNGEEGKQKPCYSCPDSAGQTTVFRTVPIDNVCPTLQCAGGGTTIDTPICEADQLPATKTQDGFTCDRGNGGNGGFGGIFPSFIDCAGEGRTADPELGEICVPPFLTFLFTGLNFLWVGLGFIVVVIILALIAKSINKQRSGVFLQG